MLNKILNQVATLIELRRWHRYYCDCGYKTNSPSQFMNHAGDHAMNGFVDAIGKVSW